MSIEPGALTEKDVVDLEDVVTYVREEHRGKVEIERDVVGEGDVKNEACWEIA